MLEQIKAFFTETMSAGDAEAKSPRRKDIRLAACALLLELAHADDHFSPDERENLERSVRRQYGLDRAQADRLLYLAEREREQAVDLWQFTNLIRQNYTTGQKMVLAEMMWGLVYADGNLAEHEAYLIRKISNLLDLEPGYLSRARNRFGAFRGDAGEDPEASEESGPQPHDPD